MGDREKSITVGIDFVVLLNYRCDKLDAMPKTIWWPQKIFIILFSFAITLPAFALVDGKKLSELLRVQSPVILPPEYVKGCIFTSLGASTECWYVIKSELCTNAVGSAFGKEEKYDKFVQNGYGFEILTACTSTGTSVNCKDKPQNIPFDYVGRCIMFVKRLDGYSSVFCIKGLPNKQADILLRSMMK
jgi:hypothetical protein